MKAALACNSFPLIDALDHGPSPSPELVQTLVEVDDVRVRDAVRRIVSGPEYRGA
jgi:hypothetical protein